MSVPRRILLLLATAALAVLGAIALYFDRVAGSAIERGASRALGVDTRVGWVRISLLTSSVRARGVTVANPPGYTDERFLRVQHTQLDVVPSTLRSEIVEVPRLELSDVEVSLEERDTGTNYATILRNLRRFQSGDAPAPEPAPGSRPRRRYRIGELRITDVVARVSVRGLARRGEPVEVRIPEIVLRDVDAREAKAQAIPQITQTVVAQILLAVAREAPGRLARDLFAGLGGLTRSTLETADELRRSPGRAVVEMGEAARRAGEGAGKVVRGLLGRGEEQ